MSSVLRSARVLSVLVLLALGAVDAAHGAAILLTDQRQSSAEVAVFVVPEEGPEQTDADSVQSEPPSPFAPWVNAVGVTASLAGATAEAAAFHTSSITPTLFTGDLFSVVFTSVSSGSANASAMTDFRVGFELTTPHRFVLTGFLGASPGSGQQLAGASLSFGEHDFSAGDDLLDLTGVLEPGVYDFQAFTSAIHVEDIGPEETILSAVLVFDFALTDLAAVPEPSTWFLMGAAAAGAAWFARRRVRA